MLDYGFPARFAQPYVEFARQCRADSVYDDPFAVVDGTLGAEVRIVGETGPITTFMTFDYLGLGNHPTLVDSLTRNARACGTGFATSRATIDSRSHQELESEMAVYKRAESGSCVVTSTGYGANQLIIPLLLAPLVVLKRRYPKRRKKILCIDAQSHASLHDALGTVAAKYANSVSIRKYRHLDYAMLEEYLESVRDEDADRFIVSDTLFSIGGDYVDVKRLLAIAKRYQAFLILDGAHSDGVCGLQGRGWVEEQGITDPEDLRYIFHTGTFSKMFAGIGGFITLFPALAESCRYSQWAYIFSAPLPTFLVRSYQETLSLLMGEFGDERRLQLRLNAQLLRTMLREEGFAMLPSESQIISVLIGDETLCQDVQRYLLREHHVLSGAIRAPATEVGNAVLRNTVSASHTPEQLGQLVHGLKKARDKYRF